MQQINIKSFSLNERFNPDIVENFPTELSLMKFNFSQIRLEEGT
jgi:hypothetical protein